MKRLQNRSSTFWTAMLVLVVYGVFAVAVGGDFTTGRTLSDILDSAATDGLLAVALTIPLLAGEIDLSIGANLALSGVIFITMSNHEGAVLGALVAIAAGAGIGLANTALVCVVGANSFVATLAMLYLVESIALLLAHGASVAGTAIQFSLDMGKNLFGPIEIPFLILAIATIALTLFTSRTIPGRDLIAIGGNREAAKISGIRIYRRTALAFVISGTIAAISGVQLAAATLTADPTSGGTDLLTAATAVFLGGVSLSGGRGSALASALAVIALSTMKVGLQLGGVGSGVQDVVIGTALVTVVSIRAVSAKMQGVPVLPRYLRFDQLASRAATSLKRS